MAKRGRKPKQQSDEPEPMSDEERAVIWSICGANPQRRCDDEYAPEDEAWRDYERQRMY